MSHNFKGKIFFLCHPQGPPHLANYQHAVVCLAEGLKSLGVEFYANRDYWKINHEENKYLLQHHPQITPDDCDVVVWSHEAGFPKELVSALPENLFHPQRKYLTVFFDNSDADQAKIWSPEFKQFDLILKSHFNSKCVYNSNVYPWAFGLSERMIKFTENVMDFHQKKKKIIVNYRLDHYAVRQLAMKRFLPRLEPIFTLDTHIDTIVPTPEDGETYLLWAQTGRRHYVDYYNRLKETAACAAFGGKFIYSYPRNHKAPHRLQDRILNKLDFQPKRVIQWDSWRFWESLAAGCLTFHIDFERHGLRLPVMPENWKHYIGINLDNVEASIRKIQNNPDILPQIAFQGKQWAIENYNPKATALRFLNLLNSRKIKVNY